MVNRESYLNKIRGFYDSDLIKIITGIRRSGKSIILKQIMKEISKKTNNNIYLFIILKKLWFNPWIYNTKNTKNSKVFVLQYKNFTF